MSQSLDDLVQLTDALYQAELGKMKEINAREASLRQNLAELEACRRSNLVLPDAELTPVRQIGADLLWEGWVSRTRADLNVQLAQILAQKAHMTVALRHAFGKQIAAKELLQKTKASEGKQRAKSQQQLQDALQLIKSQIS